MTDDTSKKQKESIAGRIKRLLAPESDCGCCSSGVKVVPKKTDEKKQCPEAEHGRRTDDRDRG